MILCPVSHVNCHSKLYYWGGIDSANTLMDKTAYSDTKL